MPTTASKAQSDSAYIRLGRMMWLVCLAQLIEGGVWEERMGSDWVYGA